VSLLVVTPGDRDAKNKAFHYAARQMCIRFLRLYKYEAANQNSKWDGAWRLPT
jgi:hypothetical protein